MRPLCNPGVIAPLRSRRGGMVPPVERRRRGRTRLPECGFLYERSSQRKQKALGLPRASTAGNNNVRLIPDNSFERLVLVKMEVARRREETVTDERCNVGNKVLLPVSIEER